MENNLDTWLKIIVSIIGIASSVSGLFWFVVLKQFDVERSKIESEISSELRQDRSNLYEFLEKKAATQIEMIFKQGDKIAEVENKHTTEIALLRDRSMETKQKLTELEQEVRQVKETANLINNKLDVLIERVKKND